jgi:hypothetical protein
VVKLPLNKLKRYRFLLLLVGGLALAALACGGPATVTPSPRTGTIAPATTSAEQPLAGIPVAVPAAELDLPAVAPFTPAEVRSGTAVAPYPLDLAAVTNPELLTSLSGAQQAILARNGFVVAPAQATYFDDIYREAQSEGQPIYITSDVLLHTFWLVADGVVSRVEQNYLLGDLQALSQAMVTVSLAQLRAAQATSWGDAVEEAAWRNLAFFSVGSRLLQPEFDVPPAVAGVVTEEVFLIEQAQGIFISPLTGQQQDYEQFRVYDRYAEEEPLARYYRALTWYGHISFLLSDSNPERARLATRQALLIAGGLESEEDLARWQRLWQLARFFYGAAGPEWEESWSLSQVTAVARAVYGDLPGVLDLADLGQLDSFIVTVYALQAPAGNEEGSGAAVAAAPFRFLPERRRPDAFFLDQLIFNRVGVYRAENSISGDEESLPFTAVSTTIGPVRAFARGLDLAALFGSQRALVLLSDAGDTAYDGYHSQFNHLQEQAPPWDEGLWTQNLAGGWLYSLQPLLEEPAPGAYPFMNSPAWIERQLNSWFGGWVELRRRPAQSEPAENEELRPAAAVNVHVEPQPLLYARLAALAAQLNQEVAANGAADEKTRVNLLRLEQLLLALKTISEKEVQAEPLTPDETILLRALRQHLLALASSAAPIPGPAAAALATIHHDPHSNQVLQVGLGEAWRLFVITWLEDEPVIAIGAVYSTYEFKRPAGGRLSAGDWQSLSPRPPWPDWTAQYVAP